MLILSKCNKCTRRLADTYEFCRFCIDHDNCSFEQDEKLPRYTYETAKQIIFDCIAELDYGNEKLSNQQISAKLQGVLSELDKMNVIEE